MEKLNNYQKFKINLDNVEIDINFYKEFNKIIRLLIDIFWNEFIFNIIYPCKNNKNLEVFKKYHFKFRKEKNKYKITLEKNNIIKLIYFISWIIKYKQKNENDLFPKKLIYIMLNNRLKKNINIKINNYFSFYSKINLNFEDKLKYSENKNLNLSSIICMKSLAYIFNLSKNVNDSFIQYSNLIRRFF